MARKGFTPQQIVAELRQIEVHLSQGKKLHRDAEMPRSREQRCHRWSKDYGGLQLEQAKRLKELSGRTIAFAWSPTCPWRSRS